MEPAQAMQELNLVVARVTAVEAHPGARGPSALVTLALGGRGDRQAPVPIALEEAGALVGTQVVCALGSSSSGAEDAIVLAVHPHDSGLVLLRPEREVEDGLPVA